MLDRTIAPDFKSIKKVTIPQVNSSKLSNGRKVFYLNDQAVEVFKIDLVIPCGSWFAENYNLISLALKMLNEGTTSKNAHQLAESIDFIGSFTEFTPGFDQSTISFYGLSRLFDENLALLSEIISSPSFDEQQFETLKKKEVERLKLNFEKSSYLSSIALRSSLFGLDHPYGRSNSVGKIEAVQLSEVKAFFASNFSDFDIMLSGKLPHNFLDTIELNFGKDQVKKVVLPAYQITNTAPRLNATRKPAFVQSSIKIGKVLFNRRHPDYMKFMVTNELFGGFFGSRLMKNIREEKGFTYGIHSHLYSLNQEGYFSIGTDVNGENEQATIDEIFKEIERLQQEPVSENELEIVKSYMAGSFAGSVNSPFAIMEKFKAVYFQGLDMGFYEQYLNSIYKVNSKDISEMVNTHLQPDSFYTCIAGPEKS
ncbi:M16 family metallopeptidase [Roseivirga echinicomitans]